ncbi:MAG: hypothetical protein JOZ91_01985 [Candidatus Eremiobacteraeota bacterium]|nr:hypothetical protein [Candidatus Eremiobacteraeota bacterium]MBV8262400.1 hypothetical protein [Candidatus Eremiobacteraeota bacterium]
MNARLVAAAVFTSVALALLVVQVTSWPQSARFASTAAPDSPCTLVLTAVDQRDRLAGFNEGDRLLLPRMSEPARLAVAYRNTPVQVGRAGDRVMIVVERGAQTLAIPYLLQQRDSKAKFLAQLGFKLFILVVGIFTLWRGRDRAALILGIWCLGVAVALPDAWWGGLSLSGRLAGGALTAALWTYSPFMLYLVVESIATGVSQRAIWVARGLMTVCVVPNLIVYTINATAQAQNGCAVVQFSPSLVNALFVSAQLVIIGFFAVSYMRTAGLARQRVRWIFWSFLVSRLGVLLNLFNRLAIHPVQLSGIEWMTIMLFPLGCAYAILRHRIIDVNFVLNRTLVYTVLTTLVVGIFILVENVLNTIAVGRGISLTVEIVVALGLGLSFNALHKRVETALERTLFRRKYEAAVALQQLVEEAAFTENVDALVRRTTAEVPRAIGATGAALYERRDSHYALVGETGINNLPSAVDIDDLAFVRLRARLSQVDLADVTSALGGDAIAFALGVRGQLEGALVLGRRPSGESYSPDEIRMLRGTAHEIAAELHAIRARERAELLSAVMSGSIDVATAKAKLASLS